METTETMNKPKKTSLVKIAAWSILMEILGILIYLFLIFKSYFTFIPNNLYLDTIISMFISFFIIILTIGIGVLVIVQTRNPEKQDELSKLHKYKAGYISKYICLVSIVFVIWLIQDFSYAFEGDFFMNIGIPMIVFYFSQLTENLIFIILEKCNLE